MEHNICTMVQLTADDSDSFKYWSPTDMPGSEVDFGAMKVTLVRNIPVRCHHFRAIFNSTIRVAYGQDLDRLGRIFSDIGS